MVLERSWLGKRPICEGNGREGEAEILKGWVRGQTGGRVVGRGRMSLHTYGIKGGLAQSWRPFLD